MEDCQCITIFAYVHSTAIYSDAVSIYWLAERPRNCRNYDVLAVFGLTFEYLHATKRSELRFAERRKLQVDARNFP